MKTSVAPPINSLELLLAVEETDEINVEKIEVQTFCPKYREKYFQCGL